MKVKYKELILIAVLLVVFSLYPFLVDRYMLSVGISILIMVMLGQSWNIMSGYAGQFSFGHAAFFGIGAYTSSILYVDYGVSPWVGMIAGMVVAAFFGALIGFLAFRYHLKGDFFALVTLAFAEILRVLFNNIKAFKGAGGVLIPYKDKWSEFQFADDKIFYFVILTMVITATAFIGIIRRRKFGLCLVAIKESSDAAKALGVPVLFYKLLAMAISAAMAAMAGTFYAQYYGFIDPGVVYAATISVEAIVPCIIGGAGTLCGPILGALIIVPLQELSNSLFEGIGGLNMIIYGLLIVLFVMFCPNGIYGRILQKMKEKENKNGVIES
ncbi:MAG: branched-chain amino acid ABC transporter permease [Lachnospiraceae bacterium]|nr:branched-chain amino acid ABC transporter permease [Lachnospiraceae bacterium]